MLNPADVETRHPAYSADDHADAEPLPILMTVKDGTSEAAACDMLDTRAAREASANGKEVVAAGAAELRGNVLSRTFYVRAANQDTVAP